MNAARSSQVSSGVSAPIAAKSNDLRFKFSHQDTSVKAAT
jgi:hypothetical protein